MLITHRGQRVSQVNIATATASSQNYIKLFMMVNETASSPFTAKVLPPFLLTVFHVFFIILVIFIFLFS